MENKNVPFGGSKSLGNRIYGTREEMQENDDNSNIIMMITQNNN